MSIQNDIKKSELALEKKHCQLTAECDRIKKSIKEKMLSPKGLAISFLGGAGLALYFSQAKSNSVDNNNTNPQVKKPHSYFSDALTLFSEISTIINVVSYLCSQVASLMPTHTDDQSQNSASLKKEKGKDI